MDPSSAHCPRCDRSVRVIRPWPHWRLVRNLWLGFCVLLLAAFPLLSADYCYMIPSFMIVLSALGPLHGLASRTPICRRCGRGL
jgi:hypothetical protein